MVEQSDSAMGTKINRRVLQVDCALTSRADALVKSHQCDVVTHLVSTNDFGFFLSKLLASEVIVQSDDCVSSRCDRDDDADGVANVTAKTREIRDEFDEERKQCEVNEAPDERPVGAFAFLCKQPAGDHKQRKCQCQSRQEDPQVSFISCRGQLFAGIVFQNPQNFFSLGLRLLGIQHCFFVRQTQSNSLELLGLQRVQTGRALYQLGILARRSRGVSCGNPVLKCFS